MKKKKKEGPGESGRDAEVPVKMEYPSPETHHPRALRHPALSKESRPEGKGLGYPVWGWGTQGGTGGTAQGRDELLAGTVVATLPLLHVSMT